MNVTVQANLRRKVYYLALLTRHITCEARRFASISLIGYAFSVNKFYSRTSTNGHLSYNGHYILSRRTVHTFTLIPQRPPLYPTATATKRMSPTVKIISRQKPVFSAINEKVMNGHELARLWSIDRGNRILILLHLYCCSKQKLSTILKANVANLARFLTL